MKKLLTTGILVLALNVFGTMPAHAASVDDYTITSYGVDMLLHKDEQNRSVLDVTETIVADFPASDANHGLVRIFVREYDGHDTAFELLSVTDGTGAALQYHWSGDALRIGDADTYVHGIQTYIIKFQQHDVTKYYADTARDEFYWDAIGTDALVPITKATVLLTLDRAIVADHTEPGCYTGAQGIAKSCSLIGTENSDGTVSYSGSIGNIGNGVGVTVALGFPQGTFTAYQPSLFERFIQIWVVVQFVAGLIALAVLFWFIVSYMKRLNRTREVGTIVPEYLPPKNASVTAAARVAGYAHAVMTAQMLDLAVRHYIKIYEVKQKTLFASAEYEIEVVQEVQALRAEEQELLKDTFGGLPAVGSRMNLKELQNNPAYYTRTLNNEADLDKLIRGEYAFRVESEVMKKWSRSVARLVLIGALLTLSPFVLIVAGIVFAMSLACKQLTDSGLALKRYVEGLKMYIEVAEEDRLKMLQSPEGAEKVAEIGDGTDSKQLIKLYEKVLPYAVLFNQEKQWNKQLGRYYESAQASPDWYTGNNAVFNAVAFSTAMNAFSTASTAASSYSSSSGGSSGGGFAGGGGGGGGVGGW